jgi:hypothetical protein
MESLNRSNSFLLYRPLGMLSVCVAVFALSALTVGQTQTPSQAEEMRKLDFLVGEWKGEGWVLKPDGSRHNSFSQKTKVQVKDNNSTLRVKDARTYKPVISSGKNTIFIPGTPVFQSSTLDATIYYDNKLKLYRWGGDSPSDRKKALEAKLIGDRTLQYGMPFSVTVQPADGYRRTTIEVTESGEWHQMLEVWETDRWIKVEESILKRVK